MGHEKPQCRSKEYAVLFISCFLTAVTCVSCGRGKKSNASSEYPPIVSVSLLRRLDRLERDLRFVRGGTNFTLAIRDLAVALPTSTLTLVSGPNIDQRFFQNMISFLHRENVTTKFYNIGTNETRDQYCNYIKKVQEQYKGLISVIFSDMTSSFELLSLIRSQNLVQRNILYIFYWESWYPSWTWKLDGILEAMRIAILTNPRPGTFRIYYSQAGGKVGTMNLVNWWTSPTGLFRTPALPAASKVYKDLRRRVLRIPVQHVILWINTKMDRPPTILSRSYTQASRLLFHRFVLFQDQVDCIWWLLEVCKVQEAFMRFGENFNIVSILQVLRRAISRKPPWTFLSNKPGQPLVLGGRDHELLRVLSDKLRFRVKYFNPTNFTEMLSDNKTVVKSFTSTLDLVSERLADLALGDVTVTFEQNQAVEFTFPTLADSAAFVTHSPSPLNEALALVRPFQWEVWPVLVLTVILSGPILFAVMKTPFLWEEDENAEKPAEKHRTSQKNNPKVTPLEFGLINLKESSGLTYQTQLQSEIKHLNRSKSVPVLSPSSPQTEKAPSQLFWQCVWFNLALFLKQNDRIPADSMKVRLLTVLTSFAATYVISDMYSANLTSLLARPGRERPITNLEQLEEAMRNRGYQLLVEKHSFSLSTLEVDENSTGIYNKLWFLARRQRTPPIVDSGEIGMLRVRDMKNFAMLGGRETLYFDTLRFGAYNFQLSQKLYYRSSAIAVQVGCPYIQSVNKILMQLFEAGILSKMTEEEYKKLGDKRYDRGPKHVPVTSSTANFVPTESTTPIPCGNDWRDTDDSDYGDDLWNDCTEPTAPSTDIDYGGYQDYGYEGYPDYEGNQTWETEPPVSDPTIGSPLPPNPTPITPPGGPLSGGRDGPLEGPDGEGNRKARTASSEVILKPISIQMLQGAFYVLLLGYCVAGLALLLEITTSRIGNSARSCGCRKGVFSMVKNGRIGWRRLVVLSQMAKGVLVRSTKTTISNDRSESSSSTTRFSGIATECDGSLELETIPFCE